MISGATNGPRACSRSQIAEEFNVNSDNLDCNSRCRGVKVTSSSSLYSFIMARQFLMNCCEPMDSKFPGGPYPSNRISVASKEDAEGRHPSDRER